MRVSKRIALLIVLAATPLLIVCGAAAPNAAPTSSVPVQDLVGDAERGRQAFSGTCATCHGSGAQGVQGLGKDLTTSEFAIGLSDAELIGFIQTGRAINDPANTTGIPMPPRGGNPQLSDQDLADIVAYLRTLQ